MASENVISDFNQAVPTDIGLNEVILSWHFLSPRSENAKKAIAEALGFDWLTVETLNTAPAQNPSESKALPNIEFPMDTVDEDEMFPEIKPEETADLSPNAVRLNPQQEKETELVEIFNVDWDEVESLPPTELEIHFKKPPFVPLFDKKWFSGIMSLILATSTPTKEIDLNLVEKKLVNLSLIDELPTLYRNTLNRGVQIMLDVSEAMQPYERDQKELLSSLVRLLDRHQIKVFKFEFEILPQKRIVWHNNSSKSIQAEIPILMITNFFTSSRQKLWRIENYEPLVQFLKEAKNKKCPVAALVPLPETEFPDDLRKFVSCSYVWDRTTSPQVVSKIKRN